MSPDSCTQDRFTTNFFFPDGSTGSLHDGTYNATTPPQRVNLLTGKSLSEPNMPNLYGAAGPSEPLSPPPVYTSPGVGSAIPVSQLGSGLGNGTTIDSTLSTGKGSVPNATRYGGGAAERGIGVGVVVVLVSEVVMLLG